MAHRKPFYGSPWQPGSQPFGMDVYNMGYGNERYGFSSQVNEGYGRFSGGYGGFDRFRGNQFRGSNKKRWSEKGGVRSFNQGPPRKRELEQSPERSHSKRRFSESERHGHPRQRHSRYDSRSAKYTGDGSDFSDDDSEIFETWEPSEDELKLKDDEENEKSEENGEQMDVDKPEKKSAKEEPKDKKPVVKTNPRKYFCFICKVKCATSSIHALHMNSNNHNEKLQILLKEQRDQQDKNDQKNEGEKKKVRPVDNWCTICKSAFVGDFLTHQRTPSHRTLRNIKYNKCRACRLEFTEYDAYRQHYKSEQHKKISAEYHYERSIPSGSDYDKDAVEAADSESESISKAEEAAEIKEESTEAGKEQKDDIKELDQKQDDTAKEDKEDVEAEKSEISDQETEKDKINKSKENKPLGLAYVVKVEGYYCKLCSKFFKDADVAKSKHCRSVMHLNAFNNAIEESMSKEEERQKKFDERDKLTQEDIQKAQIGNEIALVEFAAKQAILKEISKKRDSLRGKKEKNKTSDNSSMEPEYVIVEETKYGIEEESKDLLEDVDKDSVSKDKESDNEDEPIDKEDENESMIKSDSSDLVISKQQGMHSEKNIKKNDDQEANKSLIAKQVVAEESVEGSSEAGPNKSISKNIEDLEEVPGIGTKKTVSDLGADPVKEVKKDDPASVSSVTPEKSAPAAEENSDMRPKRKVTARKTVTRGRGRKKG